MKTMWQKILETLEKHGENELAETWQQVIVMTHDEYELLLVRGCLWKDLK